MVAGLLLVLCVVLIVCSAGFGSDGVVKVFGYNVYVVHTDEFEQVSEGSAIIAKSCAPYDLEEDNLILYQNGGEAGLAYVDDLRMVDGSYVIYCSDSTDSYEVQEADFIGKAEVSSAFWGSVISFSLTPVGILVMAVIPCLVLVLIDVIRAMYARRPLPEVQPQFKNSDEPEPVSGLSVKPDGKASYSRSANQKEPTSADSVLFSYTAKQKAAPAPAKKKPDIIPLTDHSEKPEAKHPEPKPAPEKEPAPERKENSLGKTPVSVAAKRYMDSAVQSESGVSGDTAELPVLPKREKKDTFFPQSDAPQIGKQKPSRSVIDLEDALASAGKRPTQQYTGKRSSAILAGKNPADLIGGDDVPSDSGRYAVDDILAGIEEHKQS